MYPRNYIRTGISSIDCLITLIRGQKLPIFSGSGMQPQQAGRPDRAPGRASARTARNFAIVFAAMGVKNDVADYFRRYLRGDAACCERVVMFLNLANDPIIERILTPALRADRGRVPGL